MPQVKNIKLEVTDSVRNRGSSFKRRMFQTHGNVYLRYGLKIFSKYVLCNFGYRTDLCVIYYLYQYIKQRCYRMVSTPTSHTESHRFKSRTGDDPDLGISSLLTGKCKDNALDLVTTSSFHILPNHQSLNISHK